VVFNSRATAQLVLRPWRQRPNYGLWLLALATALAVELDLVLGPLAPGLDPSGKVYRVWFDPFFDSAAWTGHLVWAAIATAILAWGSPILMRKTPASFLPDYWALVIWLAPNVLFVGAAMVHHRAVPAVALAVAVIIMTAFALRSDVRIWRIH